MTWLSLRGVFRYQAQPHTLCVNTLRRVHMCVKVHHGLNEWEMLYIEWSGYFIYSIHSPIITKVILSSMCACKRSSIKTNPPPYGKFLISLWLRALLSLYACIYLLISVIASSILSLSLHTKHITCTYFLLHEEYPSSYLNIYMNPRTIICHKPH